jgi:hypothetical protein
MIKKPLVLTDGLVQQLQPQDTLQAQVDIDVLYRVFQQLLISCALQGIEPMFDELQTELAIAMKENER